MKLAINYSPEAEALAGRGAVDFDLFKCPPPWDPVVPEHAPDLFARALAVRPVYLHFPLNAGDGSLGAADWEQVEEALAQTGTPFVNVHLLAPTRYFADMPPGTTAPAHVRRVLDALVRDVGVVAARFGPEQVIAENVVYGGAGGKVLRPCVDPDVISEVVRQTGCGFLLDTAHARLSAAALGVGAQEYVARLPVARLAELHVTGARPENKRGRDSMPMGPEDWALAEWALGHIGAGAWGRPWAVALEYGGVGPIFAGRSEEGVIAEQLPRLKGQLSTALSSSSPG